MALTPGTRLGGYDLEMNLSYVHGVGTTPLLADTIGGALNRAAERWGDCDALVACHQQLRYSYRELRDEADRAARALISLGVQRGERVGIWSGNRAEWMITQYAAAKVGAVLVNINPAYRLQSWNMRCGHSGVSVLITARGFRSTDYGNVAESRAAPPGFATSCISVPRRNLAGSPGPIFWNSRIESRRASWRRVRLHCSSTIL
jgi:acyl-CoA synthetase (AMP-forming)/AMP-acid ligase II